LLLKINVKNSTV